MVRQCKVCLLLHLISQMLMLLMSVVDSEGVDHIQYWLLCMLRSMIFGVLWVVFRAYFRGTCGSDLASPPLLLNFLHPLAGLIWGQQAKSSCQILSSAYSKFTRSLETSTPRLASQETKGDAGLTQPNRPSPSLLLMPCQASSSVCWSPGKQFAIISIQFFYPHTSGEILSGTHSSVGITVGSREGVSQIYFLFFFSSVVSPLVLYFVF